jgi:hypothetical protein
MLSSVEQFFDKGNKAAGTRARKSLQELKKLAQELRVAIQNEKQGMTAGGAHGDGIPVEANDGGDLHDVGDEEEHVHYDD